MSTCGACGHENPADRRFCESCRSFLEFTRVGGAPPAPAPASELSLPGPAERSTVGPRPAAERDDDWTAALDDEDGEQISCPACGRSNPVERRFCRRCAALLRPPPAPRVAVQRRRSLLQRAWDRANAPGRRAVAVMTAIAVAVLLLGVAATPAAQGAARAVGGFAASAAGRVRAAVAGTKPVRPVEVTATSERLPHPAQAALDGFADRWWAESAPGFGEGEALRLRFVEPFELAEIAVRNGALIPDLPFAIHPRPRVLELESDTGASTRVELEDSPELQRFRVELPVDAVLTIRIATVYPPAGPGADAAISEIDLGARG